MPVGVRGFSRVTGVDGLTLAEIEAGVSQNKRSVSPQKARSRQAKLTSPNM